MTQHKNVYQALAAAQGNMGPALKDAINPHFQSKYADLSAVVEAVRGALNENGIAFFHVPSQTELGHVMTTVLYHGESETSIEAPVPLILSKTDMQAYKSATTYAKRVGLESVTGVAPEDDDGNAASANVVERKTSVKTQSDAGPALTWTQEVLKDMAPDATENDKARALTAAITTMWKRKKSQTQLDNEWDRRVKTIDFITDKFPAMGEEIREAFELQVASFEPTESVPV